MSKSDFPEFDRAYDGILLPDDADVFNRIAAQTRFNIYNSPIWRVQGRKFTEAIIKECAYLVNDYQRSTGYTDYAKMLCDKFGIEFREEDYRGKE